MTAAMDVLAPAERDAIPMAAVRQAQARWAATAVGQRLRVLRALRHHIATTGEQLADAIPSPNRNRGEKLASEVLPLAEAIQFLERHAPRVLGPKRWRAGSAPLWLWGTRLKVLREPLGVVLIVGPSNYPLLLLAVQAVQVLAAGNAVLVKPAPGCSGVIERFAALAAAAGLPQGLFTVLPEAPQAVADAIAAGVDRVLFTGSSHAGKAVLALAAKAGIPATVELSGNDAVFVCPDADVSLAARAVAFGMRFNGGATCVAPGRVFVPTSLLEPFVQRLAAACQTHSAVVADEATIAALRRCMDETITVGGRVVSGGIEQDGTVRPIVVTQPAVPSRLLGEGVFGPIVVVVGVSDMGEALRLDDRCPYHLGATVFGGKDAEVLARQVNAGMVVINDMIVPHADPRLPFGGRGSSGFGVTRGMDGLLELTRPKAISVRRGTARPHLRPTHPGHAALFVGYLHLRHGQSLRERLGSLVRLIRSGRRLR